MIWLAHALLRLYPRSFRHRYASEIVAFIASERDTLRHRGFTDGVRMTLGLVVDVFLTALRLRYRQALHLLQPGAAVRILCFDDQVDVRILPVEPVDDAFDRDLACRVESGLAVMRTRGREDADCCCHCHGS